MAFSSSNKRIIIRIVLSCLLVQTFNILSADQEYWQLKNSREN